MQDKKEKQKSFTVIELLVVIAIIGLLSSIVLVATKGVRKKARIAKILQFSASVKHALGADIVGEWNFEDNLDDTSGNENHGEGSGVAFVPNDASSQLGKAGSFVASEGDYVTVDDSDSLDITTALTISVWIKPSAIGGRRYIVAKRAGIRSPNNYNLELNNNKVEFWTYADSWYGMFSDSEVPLNEWSHWVVTYNKGEVKMYKNGEYETAVSCYLERCTFPSSLIPNNQDFSIGGSNDGRKLFDGYIDEVRIYKAALSSAQIQKHYAEGARKRGLAIEK